MTDHDSPPVACSLDGPDLATRRDRWLGLADRALIGKSATATGVELRYRPSEATEAELRELALAERECCGFADWLVSRTSKGPLLLEVRAAPEQAPAVWAMFDVVAAS